MYKEFQMLQSFTLNGIYIIYKSHESNQRNCLTYIRDFIHLKHLGVYESILTCQVLGLKLFRHKYNINSTLKTHAFRTIRYSGHLEEFH